MDTLRTMPEALDRLPDNTTAIITPTRLREALLSMTTDTGAAYCDPAVLPLEVPIPSAGTWVDIPQALIALTPGAMLEGASLFWTMDSNGHLGYDYARYWPNTEVPVGYSRSVAVRAILSVDPQGSGTYEFGLTAGGVIVAPTVQIDPGSSQNELTVVVENSGEVDVSAAPNLSVAVRNLDGSQDLEVLSLALAVRGSVLAT